MEPHWFARSDLIELTKAGLSLSIEDRQRFASELKDANEIISSGRRMSSLLLSQLVSDEGARDALMQRRFPGILETEDEREALETWVAVPLFRHGEWKLGDPAISRLRSCFDLPAFPTLQFDAVLPKIAADSE